MTMTMRTTATPTRPPKPERGARRYTPLPDPPKKIDMVHREILTEVHSIIRNRYKRDPWTLVTGEGYLRLYAGDRSCYVVPDCLIAFDVEAALIKEANGYSIDEIGKPPDVVMEVASRTTGERDYTVKRLIYRNMGAVEYWRFDPSGGRYHDAPLAGDILVDGEYQRIPIRADPDGTHWGYSAALGLYLVWEDGNLRFYDPAISQFLRNLDESEERVEEERAARIESDRRANSANRRAARAERGREEERAARIASNRRAASANRRAESERAARMESDRRAADAEAELERLRRLLGDLE